MVLYPELPAPRTRMIVLDVAMVVVAVLTIVLAMAVHGVVAGMARPADAVERAAGDLAADLSAPINVPVVGDVLEVPLGTVADGSRQLQAAAADQADGMRRLARALALLAALPGIVVIAAWLGWRWRWATRVEALRSARGSPAGQAVLAMRAVVGAPLPAVLAVTGTGSVDLQDPAQRRALAALELARHGLRPTPRADDGA